MSTLNKDILFLIFEELQEDSKSLFSCLMVNRLWCETAIPILWRNPWCYDEVNYSNKSSLFIIITHYLFDDIKELITEKGIQLPLSFHQSLLFDYLSFCKSINVNVINSIISIGSSLVHNQFFMQQEFYFLFMKKCSEVKYLDIRSIKHQIFYFPAAKSHFKSLCELKCDTSINYSYFYGLSHFCQYIQRLIIINIISEPNHGIVKLIEVQKNLKHFEWKDDFDYKLHSKDPYKEIFLALEKKAHSLNLLRVFFQYIGVEYMILREMLSKFYKLKILIIDDYLFFTKEQLEKLNMHELEVLNLECNSLNVISSIVGNSGGHLKKILFRPYDTISVDYDSGFNHNSLNFIRKIYENCPSIEYLSITFPPSKEHFAEFEKLLKICQNIKSLLLIIYDDIFDRTKEEMMENGKELLKILIRSAPIYLKEIRFGNEFKFSLENLEEFLEKWRGRCALSMFTTDCIYTQEDYKKLINRYKRDGVIKDFKYDLYIDEINYQTLNI
jgi:hypothetical protein